MLRLLALAVLLIACGDEDTTSAGSGGGAAGGGVGVGGGVGGQAPEGCPPGTTTEADGACRAAGVRTCADGWTLDPSLGCLPSLPLAPCGPGEMALPGETSCRPVGDCGRAPWGSIRRGPDTQHVDASYPGTDSDGSEAKPWHAVGEALATVAPGAVIAVAAGSYDESLVVQQPVTIWGRCPSLVDLGTSASSAAVLVVSSAPGTVVRGLALTRSVRGLEIEGAMVEGRELWVHETTGQAFDVQLAGDLELTDSLVENVAFAGAFVFDATMAMRRTEIRSVVASVPNSGVGLVAEGTASTLLLEGSVVRDTEAVGVVLFGAAIDVRDSLVIATRAGASGIDGYGLSAQRDVTDGLPAQVTVERSRFEDNASIGVVALGSALSLVDTSVAATRTRADGTQGLGVLVQRDQASPNPTTLVVDGAHVVDNHTAGIAVVAAEAQIAHARVSRTLPDAAGADGPGIVIQRRFDVATSAEVVGTVVDGNHEGGVLVDGAELVLTDSLIADTQPQASTGFGGLGLVLTPGFGAPFPSSAVVDHVDVVGSRVFGVSIGSSALDAKRLVVDGVLAAPGGLFGDAIAYASYAGFGPSTGSIVDSVARGAARAGVASFGATLVLDGVTLDCNELPLVGQDNQGFPFSISGAETTTCGCGDAGSSCTLHGGEVLPPDPP